MRKNLNTGGMTTVPASRQNIEHRTPYGVRPVNSPVVPVKSNVVGAMKHGGELEMNRPKKMMFGGATGPMPGPAGGRRGSETGRPLPQQPGGIGAGGKGAPAPGQNMGGQGKGGAPGQGKGPIPGVGPVPGGFMGGGAGKGTGPGMGPGAGGMPIGPGGPKGPGMRYPMGPGAGGMPMGGGMFGGGGQGMPPGAGGMPMGGGMGGMGQYMQNYANRLQSRNPGMGPGVGGMPMGAPADSRAQMQQRGMMPEGSAGYRAPGMKKGGKVSASTYNDMTGGAAGGIGRLEKSSIAAKTKSQKLKKGGKVKGYAAGGLSAGDVYAMTGKYGSSSDEETGRRDAALKAYKARQDAAEKPARKPKKAAEKYSNAPAKTYGSSERGNGPGEYKSYGDSERGNSSGPAPRDFKAEGRRDMVDRLALIKPGEKMDPNRGIAGAMKYMAKQFPDERAVAEQRADMVRRLSMYPDEKKKGGKVEAFEGSAKDMSQDKKLAKKRGMSLKAWEKSSADEKHDTQQNMKGLKKGGHVKGCKCMACGGMAKMASGGMSTAQDGMKGALRPKPTAMAKGGKVGLTFSKPLPGTKVSSKKIRATVSTAGANMKKDGMKGQLRAKASGAKATAMMKPLGMTKMAKGGKVRGAGIAQRGTKFIGEV